MARQGRPKKGSKSQASASSSQPRSTRRTRSSVTPPASAPAAAPTRMTRSRAEALGEPPPDTFETPPDKRRRSGRRASSRASSRASTKSSDVASQLDQQTHSTASLDDNDDDGASIDSQSVSNSQHVPSESYSPQPSDQLYEERMSAAASREQSIDVQYEAEPDMELEFHEYVIQSKGSASPASPAARSVSTGPVEVNYHELSTIYEQSGEDDQSTPVPNARIAAINAARLAAASQRTPEYFSQTRREASFSSSGVDEEEEDTIEVKEEEGVGSGHGVMEIDENFSDRQEIRVYDEETSMDADGESMDGMEQENEEGDGADSYDGIVHPTTEQRTDEVIEIESSDEDAVEVAGNQSIHVNLRAEYHTESSIDRSSITAPPLPTRNDDNGTIDLDTNSEYQALPLQLFSGDEISSLHFVSSPLGIPNAHSTPRGLFSAQGKIPGGRVEDMPDIKQDKCRSDDIRTTQEQILDEKESIVRKTRFALGLYQERERRLILKNPLAFEIAAAKPKKNTKRKPHSSPLTEKIRKLLEEQYQSYRSYSQTATQTQLQNTNEDPYAKITALEFENANLKHVVGIQNRVIRRVRHWRPSSASEVNTAAPIRHLLELTAVDYGTNGAKRKRNDARFDDDSQPGDELEAGTVSDLEDFEDETSSREEHFRKRRKLMMFRELHADSEAKLKEDAARELNLTMAEQPTSNGIIGDAADGVDNRRSSQGADARARADAPAPDAGPNAPPVTPKRTLFSPLKPIFESAVRLLPFFRSDVPSPSRGQEQSQTTSDTSEMTADDVVSSAASQLKTPDSVRSRLRQGVGSRKRESVMQPKSVVSSAATQRHVHFDDIEQASSGTSPTPSISKNKLPGMPMSVRRQREVRQKHKAFQEAADLRQRNLLPTETEEEQIEREKNEYDMYCLNARLAARKGNMVDVPVFEKEMESAAEDMQSSSVGATFAAPDPNASDTDTDASTLMDIDFPSTKSSKTKSWYSSRPSTEAPVPGSFFSTGINKAMDVSEKGDVNVFSGGASPHSISEGNSSMTSVPSVGRTFAFPDSSSVMDSSDPQLDHDSESEDQPAYRNKPLEEWNSTDYNEYMEHEYYFSPKLFMEAAEAMKSGQVPPMMQPLKRSLENLYDRAEREVSVSKKRRLAEVEELERDIEREKMDLLQTLDEIKKRKLNALAELSTSDDESSTSGSGPVWDQLPPPSPTPAHAQLPRNTPGKGSVTFAASPKTNNATSPGPNKPAVNSTNGSPLKPALKGAQANKAASGSESNALAGSRSPSKQSVVEDEGRSSLTGRQRESYERKMSEVNKYAPKQPSRLRETSRLSNSSINLSQEEIARIREESEAGLHPDGSSIHDDSMRTIYSSGTGSPEAGEQYIEAGFEAGLEETLGPMTPGRASSNIFSKAAKTANVDMSNNILSNGPPSTGNKFVINDIFPDMIHIPSDPLARSLASQVEMDDYEIYGPHDQEIMPLIKDTNPSPHNIRAVVNAALAN